MPLNTENESNIQDNSDDTTQRLEKYGVWVKKAPHEVKPVQIDTNDTTLSPDELYDITSSVELMEEKPETEEVTLEEFGLEEHELLDETQEELPEQNMFNSFDEELNSLISDDIDTIAPKEITETEEFIIDNGGEESIKADTPVFSVDEIISDVIIDDPIQEQHEQIKNDEVIDDISTDITMDDIDFSSFSDGDIDISAFMPDEPSSPKPASGGSEEIDLDSFMSDDSSSGFSDGDIDLSAFMDGTQSVHLDNFIPSTKKAEEIAEEPPLHMNLSFDDNFAQQTKADPVNDVETISMETDGSFSEFSSFDDMFDSITDTGDAITDFTEDNSSSAAESKKSNAPVYDDASEFDDILSSLDDTPQIQVAKEEAKPKTISTNFDLTVNLEDDVNTIISEKEEDTDTEDSEMDDIPLFTGSESGSYYKELDKTANEGYTMSKVLEARSDMEFDELDDLLKEADLISDISTDESISLTESDLETSDIQVSDDSNIVLDTQETPSSFEENSDEKIIETQETVEDFDISFDDFEFSAPLENTNTESELSQDISEPIQDFQTEDFDLDLQEETVISSDDMLQDEEVLTEFDEFTLNTINAPAEIEEDAFENLDDYTSIQNEIPLEEAEIDIEIPQETMYEDLNTDDLDSLSQNLPDDFSIEDDLDTEETLHEPVAQEYLDEIHDDVIIEQEHSMDHDQNPLLDKISQEISLLRAEITSLKNELSSLKNKESANTENTTKETSGFFTDDEGDDTIALSGDELNNILINADFTEEFAETPLSDSIEQTAVEEMDIEEPFVEDTISEQIIAEELEVNESDDTEQKIELEPFDPFGSVSDVDSIATSIEQEDFFEDDTISIDENLQEPTPEELSIDSLKFQSVEDVAEVSAPIISDVADIVVSSSTTDLLDAMEEQTEFSTEDILADEQLEEDSFDEPTDTVFESSQWDDSLSVEDTIEPLEDTITEPVYSLEKETPLASKHVADETESGMVVPQELQQDIKSVLLYMDQLLENLPEDKIEEFARSEHFNMYKKLFNELGLV